MACSWILDIRLRKLLFRFKIFEVTGVNDLLTHLVKSVASAVREMYTTYFDVCSMMGPSLASSMRLASRASC